jgi:serine/threonine protein kinase
MATGLHVAGGLGGHRVGRYILRRWLAQGGMAELYLATHEAPSRASQIVVVKRVLAQFSQDPQFARMFAREAQLASALKHPNIVEVFESHAEGADECFFAMEYVHGPDLAEVLRTLKDNNGAVPLSHALTLAAGICAGLEHAHEQRDEHNQPLGIVHRDVSPSNVMIAHDGTIKIMDFGVAKALALTSFTQAGTRKGKLSYMSPEQAVADPVDRRTDVFAIGAVLFELTTMQRMLGGDNELAVMHKLLFRERPKPSEIKAGYPIDLERIVLKAVAQSPSDRFQTAGAMQQAIEEFARRNSIRLSATALAQWIGTVIPPKPHPATDPEFFATPVPAAPLRETTLTDGLGPSTLAGLGSREEATALDTPMGLHEAPRLMGPATAVGHLVARDHDPAVAQFVPVSPSGMVIVQPEADRMPGVITPHGGSVVPRHVLEMPVAPIGATPMQVTAVPRPRTSGPAPSKSGVHAKPRANANAGMGFIIGIAGVIAATAVLAAVWYTRNSSDTPTTVPATAPAKQSEPAPPPPVVAEPAPTLVEPTPTLPVETPTPSPIEPTPPLVAPEAPRPSDVAVPSDPAAKKRPRDKDKERPGKKKVDDKPAPEPKTAPAVADKKPPPPPPPPPPRKDKPRTDTLLPPGG